MVELGSGCDNLVSEPIPGRKCANEDVGPPKGGGLLDPTSPREVDPLCLICTCPPPLAQDFLGAHWLRVP